MAEKVSKGLDSKTIRMSKKNSASIRTQVTHAR